MEWKIPIFFTILCQNDKHTIYFIGNIIRFVIKHFTIVINNTIQMNGGQYIEHMNNYQGKEDEKCLDKE